MRTILVPLSSAVEAQLSELGRRDRDVARAIIARLRLEPELGQLATRGLLADARVRRVRFDADTDVSDVLVSKRDRLRTGAQDQSAGAKLRVVYWEHIHPQRDVRFIEVLSVGAAHRTDSKPDVYDNAAAIIRSRQEGDRR